MIEGDVDIIDEKPFITRNHNWGQDSIIVVSIPQNQMNSPNHFLNENDQQLYNDVDEAAKICKTMGLENIKIKKEPIDEDGQPVDDDNDFGSVKTILSHKSITSAEKLDPNITVVVVKREPNWEEETSDIGESITTIGHENVVIKIEKKLECEETIENIAKEIDQIKCSSVTITEAVKRSAENIVEDNEAKKMKLITEENDDSENLLVAYHEEYVYDNDHKKQKKKGRPRKAEKAVEKAQKISIARRKSTNKKNKDSSDPIYKCSAQPTVFPSYHEKNRNVSPIEKQKAASTFVANSKISKDGINTEKSKNDSSNVKQKGTSEPVVILKKNEKFHTPTALDSTAKSKCDLSTVTSKHKVTNSKSSIEKSKVDASNDKQRRPSAASSVCSTKSEKTRQSIDSERRKSDPPNEKQNSSSSPKIADNSVNIRKSKKDPLNEKQKNTNLPHSKNDKIPAIIKPTSMPEKKRKESQGREDKTMEITHSINSSKNKKELESQSAQPAMITRRRKTEAAKELAQEKENDKARTSSKNPSGEKSAIKSRKDREISEPVKIPKKLERKLSSPKSCDSAVESQEEANRMTSPVNNRNELVDNTAIGTTNTIDPDLIQLISKFIEEKKNNTEVVPPINAEVPAKTYTVAEYDELDNKYRQSVKELEELKTAMRDIERERAEIDEVTGKLRHMAVSRPFDLMHLKLLGPFTTSRKDNQFILAFQDEISKYADAIPIPSDSTDIIASYFFANIICKYGAPKLVMFDQDVYFQRGVMNSLFKIMNTKIEIKWASPSYDSDSSLYDVITKNLLVGRNFEVWDESVPCRVLIYNTMKHKIMRRTPYEMLYGFSYELPEELLKAPDLKDYENCTKYESEMKAKIQMNYRSTKSEFYH